MTVQINPLSTGLEKGEKSQQWPQFLAVLSACLMAVGTGFNLSWSTPAVPKLLNGELGFEVSSEEVAYVVMLSPLAYLIGSPFAGFFLDRIGRKYILLMLSIPQIIAWVLITTCSNIPTLYVARFLTGVCDGAVFSSLPAYTGEISEPKVRGVIGTIQSLGILCGTLLITIYGSYTNLRTSAYISLVVPVLFLVTFVWMPESPYYLLMKGRTEDARKSLQKLRRMQHVEKELEQISRDVHRQISESRRLRDIFTIKSNIKAFFILVGLRFFQQLAGMSALSFYNQIIFQEANISGITPAMSSIICCGIQALFAFCSSLFVDRFGRKPLFMISSTGAAVMLFILGGYFSFHKNGGDISGISWIPLLAMVLYYTLGAVGLLIVPNLMAGEVLSASVKSKALALFHMYLGVLISVVSIVFQQMFTWGMDIPFYVFGVCAISGILFCYFCVVETKGKTLEEIQQILKGNSCS